LYCFCAGSIFSDMYCLLRTWTSIMKTVVLFQFFDPGEVLYIYESPAGYGLVAMRLLGWIWFCYAIFFTLKHYPAKAKFYYPFFIFYTLWSVCLSSNLPKNPAILLIVML
jgi:hypothetical protein